MFKCDYDIKSNNKNQNTEKMTLENYKQKERKKGKHASSTENRRLVWEYVIWPLILDGNRNYFTLQEYHIKRDCVCENKEILPSKVAGGFVSLLVKGILVREKNIYSIHYKLIPYMRKKVHLDYGTVIREINTKK
jgi:hypothetical protein